MWLVLIVSFVACSRQSLASEWQFNSINLSEGSFCNITSEPGICRRLSQCDPLTNKQVEYSNLPACGLSGDERVICCPITTINSPSTVQSLWEIVKTDEASSALLRNAITEENKPSIDELPDVRNFIPYPSEGSNCVSKSGIGVCKRIDQCEPYRSKTLKYADLKRCSFVGFNEIVCCPEINQGQGDSRTGSSSTESPSTNSRTEGNRNKMRPSMLACQRYHDTSRTTYHILGGKEASVGEYPYIGAILYPSEQSGRRYEVQCGASLISERFALTAAHCVVKESKGQMQQPVLVRFGSVEWSPRDNNTYRFDAKIKNITAHELYRANAYYHDIALIEFDEPVPINMLIAPICLHSKPDDIDSSVDLRIAGWGITSMFSYAKADILQTTHVKTVSLIECNSTHIDYGVTVRYSRGLIEGQYCAYDAEIKKDSCSGDSGGPLVITMDDWEEVVGVVSFGMGCGSILPSIYTRVAYYIEWIEKIVWPSPDNGSNHV